MDLLTGSLAHKTRAFKGIAKTPQYRDHFVDLRFVHAEAIN